MRKSVGFTLLVGIAALSIPTSTHAADKSEVRVINTTAEAVPVAVQGTTQVTGTVTVANQPAPPAKPEPIQIRLEGRPVTQAQPTGTETIFKVPEGKLLTVEFAQLYFSLLAAENPTDAYNANLHIGCAPTPTDGPIDFITYHLPEIQGPNLYRIFGGPVKLLVPGGACLRSSVTVINTTIPENVTLYINGSITGYLSDAP
jgi:hypothetical protein